MRLTLDVMLVATLFALDVRDVWFKLRWLGPKDSYSFTAVTTHEMQETPLALTRNFTFAGQKTQRKSGWGSFLQKCEFMYPISDDTGKAQFSHAMGKNCEIGLPEKSHRVSDLVLSSNVRVDAVAWAACKLLDTDRKPVICRSSVVRLFAERYNFNEAPSLFAYNTHHSNGTLQPVPFDASAQKYPVTPGSDAESELTDLLNVISTSSPLSAVVCVEGFIPKGPGRYTATIFGCSSPSYYKSAFVGHHATAIQYFLQDKARLTSDALHVMGMTFVTRENSRSLFSLRSGADGRFSLRHKALLNFSSFGVLYTVMIALDVFLLLLNALSTVEIGHLTLWPLWKHLNSSAASHLASASYASKTGFAAHKYKSVLTSSLFRSKPVLLLTLLTSLLSWMVILPSISIWDATELQTGKTHAWLTAARVWVVPLLCFNLVWDLCVALSETRAFHFARSTYVRGVEVLVIVALVVRNNRDAVFAITEKKRDWELQRLGDSMMFREYTALSNSFAGQLDFLQNTPYPALAIVYGPLVIVTGYSVVAIMALAAVRSLYFQLMYHDVLHKHQASLVSAQKRTSKHFVVPDASESPTKPLLTDATTDDSQSVQFARHMASSPPPSPTRSPRIPIFRGISSSASDGDEHALRLPLEEIVDVPMRARSLVRSSWIMEKKTGSQVFLHPSIYLAHGVVLSGDTMRTRFGFIDVVHPFLHASEHAVATGGDQDASAKPDRNVQQPLH
uniref:Transmembrane protein n=1 Tax=Globisporangium ultimum (strain ATCC 200006 / CBS 805.95 / DAOM BR144) TaxID=431595 RepID=K3WWJ0_GLOUD